MIEKIMKAVKSSNKKRSRNITIGAVIGFLLSCTAVMGADSYLWIKEDSGEIKFSTTGDNGNWNEKNPYENAGNIWDKDTATKTKTYTNNMTLSSSAANGVNSLRENMSYGLRLSGNLTGVNFINNGSITGIMSTASGTSNGYGIYNTGTMGDITNRGVISGYGDYSGTSTGNGYGSGIYNLYTIGDITNTGIINGYGNGAGYGNGYGIFTSITNGMGNITNTGVISGSGSSRGYGIYNSVAVENVTNIGVISGSSNGIYDSYTMENIINEGIISSNGSGIYNDSLATIGAITNTGVIYGKDNAIKNYDSGTITTAKNNGILVNGSDSNDVINGLTIVDETPEENKIVNKGLIFKAVGGTYKAEEKDYEKFGKIYEEENVIIGYQKDGAGKSDLSNPITKKYTIINATALGNDRDDITGTKSLELENGILTYGDFQTINISPEKGYILNGITNTLKISGENNELNNSVINAYKTAVVMGSNDSILILNNTVVNGGILGNDPTISITGNKNILTIQGNSVINGTMESTGKNNTLNFNGNGESGINILHNISGFSNMNIGENTNVTLFEKTIGADGKETALEVSGVKEIDIKAGGVLNLRIDSQKLNGGRYEGHALFNKNTSLIINGDISQLPGGKTEIKETEIEKYKVGVFNLITNGLGKDAIIAMDGITLKENLFVKTNSILDKAVILEEPEGNGGKGKEGDIKIEDNEDIFVINKEIPRDEQKYIKLNEIYKGVHSSARENFNALKDILTLNAAGGDYTSVTDKEQLATLLSYLNNIYTRTPYSFSSELSRKSAGMFKDIVTENQFRPDMNKWLIMGGLTHRDGGTKDTYYGKNYHGFDTGTADVDTDMKLTGAYALGKYGYSENVSLGVTVGGNKSEAKLPMSKVKGNSGYVGAFAENYRGNLTLKAGAGIQYSEYDANRATLGGHSYSEKYSDMAYDIYLNGRYSHNIGENLFLEPYGTLSYTYVDQEGADEGSKVLAIETDSKSFDYTAAKVGVDLKKVIPHEKGKSTLSAGVSYTRLLTGADEENITGRFKGGSDFDILVAHKNKHSIGLNAKYALELESGILFDVKGSYSFDRDSHNESGKNRNKGEWIVGAGLGYKF